MFWAVISFKKGVSFLFLFYMDLFAKYQTETVYSGCDGMRVRKNVRNSIVVSIHREYQVNV